jgi:ATP-dependent helicase/nuclease subunit A
VAEVDDRWEIVTRYSGNIPERAVRPRQPATLLGSPLVPDWARTPAPPESRPPRPLAPSAIAADDEASPAPSAAMRAAALRGTRIHLLLERLVADAARGWL